MVYIQLNGRRLRQLTAARETTGRSQLLRAWQSELQSLPEEEESRWAFVAFLGRLYMLCPLEDVREGVARMFAQEKIPSPALQPSRFEKFPAFRWNSSQEQTGSMRSGYLDWMLSLHPELQSRFNRTMSSLLYSEGPLPQPWRHCVAMLGASRHLCEYLVLQQAEAFLTSGGDPDWLVQPAVRLPLKLRSLVPISRILAHAPWTLDAATLEKTIAEGRWSSAELAHALLILCTFHSLPSLVFACGLNPDFDSVSVGDTVAEADETEGLPLPRCFGEPLSNNIVARLRSGTLPRSSPGSGAGEEAFEGFGVLSERAGKPRNLMSEKEKEDLVAVMTSAPVHVAPTAKLFRDMASPVEPGSQYADIKVREDRVMHTVNFNWEDHGVVMLFQTQATGETVEALSEEYSHALQYTNGRIGDIECDTRAVRDALHKYVQRMYGVFHDDYPYDQLNRILPLMHKVFLKKTACFPERVNKADYWRMRKYEHLSPDDIVHYGHLVFETRRVTELTFAMRALAKIQANSISYQ